MLTFKSTWGHFKMKYRKQKNSLPVHFLHFQRNTVEIISFLMFNLCLKLHKQV